MTIDPTLHTTVLDRYCELGQNKEELLKYYETQLEFIEDEMRKIKSNLKQHLLSDTQFRELHREMGEMRKARLHCLSQRKLTKALKPIESSGHIVRRTAEFNKLCSLPQIIQASIEGDGSICFVITARIVYKGITYDLGDWEVKFGSRNQPFHFWFRSTRPYLRPGWHTGTSPDYTFDRNGFCFGENTELIENHFSEQRYSQAIQMAIGHLNSVNKSDLPDIPHAFYAVDARDRKFAKAIDKIGEVACQLSVNGLTRFT